MLPSGGAETKKLSDRVISRIWEKMSAIYGHRWVSGYGLHVDESGQMSATAETWALGLFGLSREQLQRGFESLLKNGQEWPPTLPEFLDLCLRPGDDVPTLEVAVRVLANASSREGSLADRYRHPLILALAGEVDMHTLRRSTMDKALRMVAPVYKRLAASGWPGWPEHAFERVEAIAHDRPASREAAMAGLARMRAALSGGVGL
jgi:hypothetical protein